MSQVKKVFFIIVFILFIATAGVAVWFYQRNTSSKGDLVLQLLGPESTPAGQEVEYTLKCRNQGATTLVYPELIFRFPSQAQAIEPATLIYRQELIEDIYPGQEKIFRFRGKLFGQKEEIVVAKAEVNYRLKGLKAHYVSETELATFIQSVPFTFEFSLPKLVGPSQEFQFSLDYSSYLDQPVSNLGIRLSQVEGLEILESEPQGMEEGEWSIPTLIGHDGGRIKMKGKSNQENETEMILRAQLGIWIEDQFVILKDVSQRVEVAYAPIYISQQINNSLNYVADPEDLLHYQIFFRNVSEIPIEKQFLTVRLEGSQFDLMTLRSSQGNYYPGDNTILWDWRTVPELKFLDAEEEGVVEFWVNLKDSWPISSQSPVVDSAIEIGQVRKVFSTKINSQLQLTQKVYQGEEFFQNSGPIPFSPGEETTYSVLWQVENNYNQVKDIWVGSSLPEGAELTGEVFPEEESSKLTYNIAGNRLNWETGTLDPEQKALIIFQVSFTPKEKKGINDLLVGESEVRGKDQWTEKVISNIAPVVEKASTTSSSKFFQQSGGEE